MAARSGVTGFPFNADADLAWRTRAAILHGTAPAFKFCNAWLHDRVMLAAGFMARDR